MWHHPEPDSPETTARRKLGDWGWNELNAIRARVALKRGWADVKALHPMDPGRPELAERLRESGASGEESLRHVLALAEADANFRGTVEYLTGSLFEPVPWRKKLAMRMADVGKRPSKGDRARAPERESAREALEQERNVAAQARARTREAEPPPVIVSAGDREEARLELAKLREQFGIPRAEDGLPPALTAGPEGDDA